MSTAHEITVTDLDRFATGRVEGVPQCHAFDTGEVRYDMQNVGAAGPRRRR